MRCKDCEILLTNTHLHNTTAKWRKNICTNCIDNDSRAKNICYRCGDVIKNSKTQTSLQRFVSVGNLCKKCISDIARKL